MKQGNARGMSFGFSVVNAGQRNTNAAPQVIATSTEGCFRLTPAVTKALNIGHGEYAMFISNVQSIDAAILAKDETIVAFCEEQGLELGTPEAAKAIHAEFDVWAVAKGIQEFDTKGNPKMITERLSKKDKAAYVEANFDEMLAAIKEADDEAVSPETKEAVTRDGVTHEEQVDILMQYVQPREVAKYRGSKVANANKTIGAGTPLTFTDSNVWAQIKEDMSEEDAASKNRVFDVDVEEMQTITVTNGYEDVEVPMIVLGEYTDKESARRGAESED